MKKLFLSLLLVYFTFFTACGEKNTNPDRSQMSRASYYDDLIKNAVNVLPEQLGIKISDKEITVYGVITQQNIGGLIVLVSAAYAGGETVEIAYGGNCFVIAGEKGIKAGVSGLMYDTANKYLKYYEQDIEKYWKGYDMQTLSQNLLMTLFIQQNTEEIKDETKKFIESAQKYVSSLTDVDKDGLLAEAGTIKIIFLTNKGRFFVQAPINEMTAYDSNFASFFKNRSDIAGMVFKNFSFASNR
ncbi:MAG: hypothetical protein LBL00_08275 [Endomicrobium sp.]|jgi:hypothetical protein|nr:hypothetical protein [Endomicrobium sp.]